MSLDIPSNSSLIIKFVLVGGPYPISVRTAQFLVSRPEARLVAVFADLRAAPTLAGFADANNIPLFPTDRLKGDGAAALLQGLQADWFLNAYGTVIFSPAVLALYPSRALNLHPGPLPEYAGLHMHQWAIRNGESEYGVTLHIMTKDLDAGPIMSRRSFPIRENDTGLSLFNRTMRVSIEVYKDALCQILTKKELPAVQQQLTRYRIYRHRDALDGRVDWRWSARQITDFIRAGNYLPGRSPTYTAYLEPVVEKPIELFEARPQERGGGVSGAVLALTDDGPVVACHENESVLLVNALKDGKKMTQDGWDEYLSGISHGVLCPRPDKP